MRNSIGGTWILALMIVFISLFSAFIILMVNYSKTVKVKDEALNIIEKYEGLNYQSIQILNDYLKFNAYTGRGTCTKTSTRGIYGAYSLDDYSLEEAKGNTKYYYCVKKFVGKNRSNYYQISLFYKFNLPFINNRGGFIVRGTSSNIVSYDDGTYYYPVGGGY